MIRTEDDVRAAYEVLDSADPASSIAHHRELIRVLAEPAPATPAHRRGRSWLAPALSAAAVAAAVVGGVVVAGLSSGTGRHSTATSAATPAPPIRYLGPITSGRNYEQIDLHLAPAGNRKPALTPTQAYRTWCSDIARTPATWGYCSAGETDKTMVLGAGTFAPRYGFDKYDTPPAYMAATAGRLMYVLTWTRATCPWGLISPSQPKHIVHERNCHGVAAIDATTGLSIGEVVSYQADRPRFGAGTMLDMTRWETRPVGGTPPR